MASLLALARAASEVAKRYLWLTLWAHGVAAAFGVIALGLTSPWDHCCAVCALAAELGAWILRRIALSKHSQAEDGRRAALISWAYASPEPVEASDLRASFGSEIERRAVQLEGERYYDGLLPPGRARFLEAVQESAYWSKHLYTLSGWTALAVSFLAIMCSVLVFILLGPIEDSLLLQTLTRVSIPIVSFLAAIDWLGQGLDWLEAGKVASRVDFLLCQGAPSDEPELLALYADYSAATAAAAPIPTIAHTFKHSALEAEWKRRAAARSV